MAYIHPPLCIPTTKLDLVQTIVSHQLPGFRHRLYVGSTLIFVNFFSSPFARIIFPNTSDDIIPLQWLPCSFLFKFKLLFLTSKTLCNLA